MPPLLSDNSDDEDVNGVSAHTESRVEADVEVKDQLKDDFMTDVEETNGAKAAQEEKERVSPTASVQGDDDDEEEDEEEAYEVEAIHDHEFRRKGKQYVLLYNVKWKNYPTSENTLEPEENLVGSRDILAKYHHKIGGAPQPPTGGGDLKKKSSRKSLRTDSQASATEDSPAPPAKRQKRTKDESDAEDDDDGGEDFTSSWQPKSNNWEIDIKEIRTVERETSGDLYIFIVFKNGKKSRVKNGVVRKKCPQRLLDFYEKHLSV
ncbi:hypothetical protein LTR64_002685 [Lithohypha guttulata]|uniref:uncharacterized protein n=1 Tax=Lithohypha guttulata TaxID=1690604 RepID=UPI002DE1EBE2|nr:hypothetical protein LTR51_001091 [Lithohypha guttulata]